MLDEIGTNWKGKKKMWWCLVGTVDLVIMENDFQKQLLVDSLCCQNWESFQQLQGTLFEQYPTMTDKKSNFERNKKKKEKKNKKEK